VGKAVLIDKRAEKELKKFSRPVQLKFQALFEILEEDGKLEEPFGKKTFRQEKFIRNTSKTRLNYSLRPCQKNTKDTDNGVRESNKKTS